VARYFSTPQVSAYKTTRNGLTGTNYSSKFSPWLATGALSARTAYVGLERFEKTMVPMTAPTGCGLSCCGAIISG
jgi:deoxyribodipyrimidine photo-lyase